MDNDRTHERANAAERLHAAFEHEMAQARSATARHDLDAAFLRLERAHILGQSRTWLHVRAHIAMLFIGWRRRDARELVGQVLRVVAAATKSRIWVPLGNTGGANVSPFRPMPVPDDLAAVLAGTASVTTGTLAVRQRED